MPQAGYSGTPLPKKLGIRPGARVACINAPAGFEQTLGALPPDSVLRHDLRARGPLDVILCFTTSERALVRELRRLPARLTPDGGLWLCWPKLSSGVESDLSDGVVRERGLATGLVDNKVCAIDQTWSGLRFVARLEDRP